jgi:hypothetical protein
MIVVLHLIVYLLCSLFCNSDADQQFQFQAKMKMSLDISSLVTNPASFLPVRDNFTTIFDGSMFYDGPNRRMRIDVDQLIIKYSLGGELNTDFTIPVQETFLLIFAMDENVTWSRSGDPECICNTIDRNFVFPTFYIPDKSQKSASNIDWHGEVNVPVEVYKIAIDIAFFGLGKVDIESNLYLKADNEQILKFAKALNNISISLLNFGAQNKFLHLVRYLILIVLVIAQELCFLLKTISLHLVPKVMLVVV